MINSRNLIYTNILDLTVKLLNQIAKVGYNSTKKSYFYP